MNYLEAKWIVKEVESLVKSHNTNSSLGWERYRKVIGDDIYPSTLSKMPFHEVVEIINSHYGVYRVGDIVTDKVGIPCYISYIDCGDAETLHDVRYHVIYQGGLTDTLHIGDIVTKLGTYNDAMILIDEILGDYFKDEMEKINDAGNTTG